jgi:hypothetical protein
VGWWVGGSIEVGLSVEGFFRGVFRGFFRLAFPFVTFRFMSFS